MGKLKKAKPKALKSEVVSEIVDMASSYCDREQFIIEKFGIDLEQLEELMANNGYERCSECEWWCETGELVDAECNTVPCRDCRGHDEEDE